MSSSLYNTNTHASLLSIRQNAANSPLLSLPSEIRERILKFLLGEKLIHVRYLNGEELRAYKNNRNIPWNIELKGAFRNTVCSALGLFDSEPEALGDNGRHKNCKIIEMKWQSLYTRDPLPLQATSIPEDLHRPMRDALTILSVCRQLYEESNFILWSTNTFSFDHAPSLIEFISSLNPAQKRNMKSLHLIINAQLAPWYEPRWSQVLNTKYLSMLRGLETLQLCIEHRLHLLRNRQGPLLSDMVEMYKRPWASFVKACDLETLRLLPLKHASVSISDDRSQMDTDPYNYYGFLTDKLKVAFAAKFREKLLDPQGAELQQAAESKEKAAEKAWIAERSETRANWKLRTARDNLQKFQRQAKIAAQHASQLRTAAKKAIAAAGSGSREYSKTQVARMTARAQKAKATADMKKSNLRIWQERVTDRQQKIQQANLKEPKIKAEADLA